MAVGAEWLSHMRGPLTIGSRCQFETNDALSGALRLGPTSIVPPPMPSSQAATTIARDDDPGTTAKGELHSRQVSHETRRQFIAAGDVVTARLAFQRAAEAGDANAAVALGATSIPRCLQSSVWWE